MTETRPASRVTKLALDLLKERYQRDMTELVRVAAEAEGVDEADGWALDASGTWFREVKVTVEEALNGSPRV